MKNPIIPMDYPDVDVIRVGEKYYMVSTTMYFMPGCEILQSDDLLHWSHASYVYDVLEYTEEETLTNGKNAYGKGMWAATLRYHNGKFYVCFVANDTGKTYLFTSEGVEGPWERKNIEGFYHDCSLLFDDEKVYIAYGNTKVYLTELDENLNGPKEGGFHKCIVEDTEPHFLGYEGSHLYKINGYYYIFLIHAPVKDHFMRTEACFMTASLEEPFIGGDIFEEDLQFRGSGVAQGGIVETKDGEWYGFLFQDRGAAGRFPVLVPMHWEEHKPVFGTNGKMPKDWEQGRIPIGAGHNSAQYENNQLSSSDDFTNTFDTTHDKKQYGSFGMSSKWQFNHVPELDKIALFPEKGIVRITNNVASDLECARNTLTQRVAFPKTIASVTLDVSGALEGDVAGLCALQGLYGYVAYTKENGKGYLVMRHRELVLKKENKNGTYRLLEEEKIPYEGTKVTLVLKAEFEPSDRVSFYYLKNGVETQIGSTHLLSFTLDHFTGTRVGLFSFGTKKAGGYTDFSHFTYEI